MASHMKTLLSNALLFCLLFMSPGNVCAQMLEGAGVVVEKIDSLASQIAGDVMDAVGGQRSWEKTRYLSWNFFGARKLTWDRYTGDVRIHEFKTDTKILMNVNTGQGKVSRAGQLLSDTSSECKKALERGKKILINDSYWLIMPMKLKDPGLVLTYLGKGKTVRGDDADVLRLVFDRVGVTPENKYHVYVDLKSRLVTQWDFFRSASDEKPEFSNPWTDYKKYGRVLLSSGRGRKGMEIGEIDVPRRLSKKTFTTF